VENKMIVFQVVIEEVHIEQHTMELEASTAMEALDQARQLAANKSKTAATGTTFSAKSIKEKEIKDNE
jgi:hypothetical protein